MVTLVGISGSLRQGSYNSALLRCAARLMPEGAELSIATIRGIPLYDADVESSDGIPAAVTALKDAIAAAGGLLLATPEYNNSIPGVFKNAIDWQTEEYSVGQMGSIQAAVTRAGGQARCAARRRVGTRTCVAHGESR